MSTTPTAIPTEAAPTVTALQPASTGRRVVAWLIDIVIVAALVGVVYLVGLVKINGCDTWDPATQQFGGSCPFESTREVTRADGSVDLVYVLDSGRELPADHPTVKTVLLGTRIVDPPSAGTYLIGLGYVLVVYVLVQGALGWTPGKLLAGVRLAREDGRSAGVPGALVRWLVIDGGIGLVGVVMGLIGAWWPLRLLAADAALILVGGVVALVAGGRRPGDTVAGTLVVDEAALALRKASAPPAQPSGLPLPSPAGAGPDTAPTGPTPWATPGAEQGAGAAAGAAAAATFAAGRSGPAEPLGQPPASDATDPAAAPTPLPQWPSSPPTAQPTGQPPASGTASPPSTATPLGASVGAAPSALRPTPAEAPAEATTDPTGEVPVAVPADAPTQTSALIAAAGDPAVDEPAPADEPAAATEPATAEPSTAEQAPAAADADDAATAEPEPEPEPDALVPTSVAPAGTPGETSEATSPGGSDATAGEAAADRPARQPEWDEARRAYIYWDDGRQEWLQYFDDSQSWGPITRA